jgi:hypothetical protein
MALLLFVLSGLLLLKEKGLVTTAAAACRL